jgi:hypothetical protein
MAKWQQKFRKSDALFLDGGFTELAFDAATEGIWTGDSLQRPDPRTQRWDGNVDTPGIRAATAQEITDYDTARQDEQALSEAEIKAIKAAMLVVRSYCNALKDEIRGLAALLVSKGTITAAEATALTKYTGSGPGNTKTIEDVKTDYMTAWKALP